MTPDVPTPTTERFPVTAAAGCIGAWTDHQLVREDVPVVALDVGDDPWLEP